MKKSNIFILVFTLFLCFCISQNVSARSTASGRVIILAMDRIGWSDIIDSHTPNIDILIDKGSIGLMTTNTVPTLSQKNEYITLGSGVASSGSQRSQLCFSTEEYYKDDKVGDVYYQITGNNIKQGSIANLGIAQIYKGNKNRPYTVNIGAIGTVLKDVGYNTAVIGNSDTTDQYKRYLVSMLMDNEGIVSCGDVSQSLITNDNTKPFGIKTNYTKMKDIIDNVWDKADVIGIELGDTSRVEDFRNECTAEMLEYHRKKAIEDADRFIGYLLKKINTDTDLIMIISPVGPLKELSNRNRLSPIIIAGRGIQKGWIRSGSTHRDGVVTNMDIGATILGFFNLPTLPGQLGNKIHSIDNKKGLDGLWVFNQKLVSLFNQRHFLIRSYIYTDILIVIIALVLLLFRRRFLDWIKILLLFIMIVPLVYLILPIFYTASLFKNVVISVVMGITFIAALIHFFPNTIDIIFIICMGIVSCLVIDQISGGYLVKDSPLGYDVISGARFYGIGNEYMGILIGASCTATAILVEKLHKYKVLGKFSMIVIFSLVFGILVFPAFGANVGGAISAFFAFLITSILLTGRRLTVKRFVAGGCILTCLLLIVFIADSTKILDTQTHMGQTASLVRQKGIEELLKIFQRKVSMNIKLIKYTVWTKVFLTSLLAVVILFFRPVGLLKEAVFRYSAIPYGFIGGLVGCIAALLANDSGIVAAATMIIYVAPPIILLIIDQMQNKMRLGENGYGEN